MEEIKMQILQFLDQIKQLEPEGVLVGEGASEEEITQLQTKLQVTLPDSYKWFLREFGYLSVHLTEFLGIGFEKFFEDDFPVAIQAGPEAYLKDDDLPKGYVVVTNHDEYYYCLDTTKMIQGECPVIDWDWIDGTIHPPYENFYVFMRERLETALTSLLENRS